MKTMSDFGNLLNPLPLSQALIDGWCGMAELSMLPAAAIPLSLSPRGDGHGVIICPGYMADDNSTSALRIFLRSKGYEADGWNLGQNLGPKSTGGDLELLAKEIQSAQERTGGKISLIGWSLGGIIAREFAKINPDMIRQVITLGSPVTARHIHDSMAGKLYRRVIAKHAKMVDTEDQMRAAAKPPKNIPTTAIFTKTDGILPWRACIEPKADNTDNIEVYSSHSGLGFSASVYFALADRLSLPEGEWQPFDRDACAWRRAAYPSSGHQL